MSTRGSNKHEFSFTKEKDNEWLSVASDHKIVLSDAASSFSGDCEVVKAGGGNEMYDLCSEGFDAFSMASIPDYIEPLKDKKSSFCYTPSNKSKL